MGVFPSRALKDCEGLAGMFGRIAGWYDPLNRLLSLGLDQRWRLCLAAAARPGRKQCLLDIAAGTLDVSLALARLHPGTHVLAVDFCLPMLERGKRKLGIPPQPCPALSGKASLSRIILPAAADALRLPLPDACVDAVTTAFGIRNISPRDSAFREMLRVLVPGGRACILEFGSGRRKIWKGLYNFYLQRLLPLIGKWGSGDGAAYTYLAQSITEFPPPENLSAELRAAGFSRVYHVPLTSGIVCLHVAEKPAAAPCADGYSTISR